MHTCSEATHTDQLYRLLTSILPVFTQPKLKVPFLFSILGNSVNQSPP